MTIIIIIMVVMMMMMMSILTSPPPLLPALSIHIFLTFHVPSPAPSFITTMHMHLGILPNMTSINLGARRVCDVSTRIIAAELQHSHTLQVLDLSNSTLSPQGGCSLALLG
jgi:hypothetical protein